MTQHCPEILLHFSSQSMLPHSEIAIWCLLFSPQTSSTSSVPSPSGEQIETLKKTTPTNFHCPIHPPTRTCAHILCLCSGYFVSTVLLPNSLPRISSECVPFSRSVVSDSLRPHGLQHTRLPCPSPTQWAYSKSCPSSQWCHSAISSSVVPSPPAPSPSQHQSLFQWVNSSHQVAKVLEFQL